MADTRIDHIEEAISTLSHKVDDLSVQLHDSTGRLDGRIDTAAADMKAGFDQTQAAFEDHRRYTEFLWQGVKDEMSGRFNHIERRFDRVNDRFDQTDGRFGRVDERFDRMDERFDRLEQLIKER